MPSQRNITQLAALAEKFSRAKSVVFVDHNGMSVQQMQNLKSGVREAGGEITVAKNTLLTLMLKPSTINHPASPAGGQPSTDLSGPTSVLFSYQDEILPIKVLATFSKDNEKPTIKAGMLGDKPLTAAQVIELSQLPGFNELLVKLMGQIQGPMYGFVNVLQGNARKLVYALEAIKKVRS